MSSYLGLERQAAFRAGFILFFYFKRTAHQASVVSESKKYVPSCHVFTVTESLWHCVLFKLKEVKEAVSKADSQMVGVFSEHGRDGKAGESEAQRCCVSDGCFLFGTVLGYRTKADCLTAKWKGHLGKYKQRDAQCKHSGIALTYSDPTVGFIQFCLGPCSEFHPSLLFVLCWNVRLYQERG